jgi:hypothetical protein
MIFIEGEVLGGVKSIMSGIEGIVEIDESGWFPCDSS